MIEIVERALAVIREGTLPVMLPLILVCLAMWAFIVERYRYLHGALFHHVWPPARQRVRSLKELLAESLDAYVSDPNQRNRRTVVGISKKLMTPYGRFLIRALGRDDIDDERVRDVHLSRASLNAELEVERGLGLISTLAQAAPLLGLLGTVTGMIQTFRVMMFASTGDPRALSAGISIALIATEVGLAVSITGVVSSSWLNRRAQTILEEIQVATTRIFQSGGRS